MPKKPKNSHLYIKTLIIHICKLIETCTMINVNDKMIKKNHLVQLSTILMNFMNVWNSTQTKTQSISSLPEAPSASLVPHQG